ncbi:MAG: lasso peptide biosynthesis B2 protein [Gammaproteobacteria bacterium]
MNVIVHSGPPYRLADDVYVCATSRGAVFLDLKKDEYIGIDAHQAHALAPLVQGWPEVMGNASTSIPSPAVPTEVESAFARSLCAQGLLCESPACAARSSCLLSVATDELVAWECMPAHDVRPRHVFRFLWALVVSLFMLHCRSLHATVKRCERRRDARTASDICDPQIAARLLGIYTHIRMFVFARRARCLIDSITLVEFLAAYGVYPCWVIGVQVRPFAAHSWVQTGQFVLNGTPAFIRSYRPIVVV